MPTADPRFAATLAHGLDVLEAFAGAPAVLANAALAQRAGLARATITRLTTTLASRGLVVPAGQGRGHRLGSGALTLGYPLLAQLGLRRIARLPMKQLADALGASVSLGMRDRHRMVYVETWRNNDPLTFQPDLGAPLPLLDTAIGRAWLATATPSEREAARVALAVVDGAQASRFDRVLREAQRQWAAQGFCHSEGDWLPDVHAVAVPLRITLQGEHLLLNAGLPARRLAPRQLQREIGPCLLQLARTIEADWQRALLRDVAGQPPAVPAAPAWLMGHGPATTRDADPRDGGFARTLAHGIDLLRSFAPGEPVLGIRALARRLALAPNTVQRLVHTLVARGYLRRDDTTAGYRLAPAVLTAAYPMLSGLPLRRRARPAMLALAARTGGAVSLGLPHETSMVYVETAWQTDARLLPPDTGAPMPMLHTAMGRAWLASVDHPTREALLHRLRLVQPEAFARLWPAAGSAMADCRRQGWCSSADFRPEIVAVAVPFSRPVEGLRYVMNCGVLQAQADDPRRLAQIGAWLRETVAELESAEAQN